MKKTLFILLILIINIIFIHNADSMNFIIDNIYLGDKVAAANETFLNEHNIFAVVNCAYGLKIEYNKGTKLLELNMHDSHSQQLFPIFDDAYKFIKENQNSNILIHCKKGRSRSASLVIYYLMKEKGWDYDTCNKYIKKRRSKAHPNSGFKKQLKEYYNKITQK